jgi:membrane-associated phospholipid phosphatase
MMFLALVISGVCFFLYPTIYPRPPYPTEGNAALMLLLRWVTIVDQPTNCLPSMHVALAAVATWALRERFPRVCLAFVVWTLLIIFSVLATKQHYFLDVVGGLAVFVFVAFAEKFAYPQLAQRYSQQWKSLLNRRPKPHF